MVAAAAVHSAAHGIAGQAAFEGCGLDPRVELERRVEGRLGRAVAHELDRLEQAAAADVADMPVVAEALGQPTLRAARPERLTFSSNCSSAITCCTASAAAQASGCAR